MSNQSYYETMYILRPDIPEEEVDTHLTKYSDLLKETGAEVLDSQMRGKRRLAYQINKHKEGIYVQLSHNGNGQHVGVLEKAMRLSEDVIRYLTVKQDGPLPTPRPSSNNETKTKEESKEIKEEESKATKDTKDSKDSKDSENSKEKEVSKEKEEEKK